MKQQMKRALAAVLVAGMLGTGTVATVGAIDLGGLLGGVLKVGGVGYLVDRFSGQLDGFINTLLRQSGAETAYATKVVPIVSIGNKGYIGAAQVVGPQAAVDKVEAVAQVEGSFNDKLFRIRGLVPVDSKNPTKLNRVDGVGVSAIIDVRI